MGRVRKLLCGGVALASSVSAAAGPARAEIRALLVGANVYATQGISDLDGPANDLAEIEKLIRARGATDITVLKDDQVTRTRVETAFHALGLRSKPGDWVVLFYAGHGAQAEAAIKGIKKDDLDDFLVLPKINLDKPDPDNYIMSADLRNWLLHYIPSNVTVLQMVDACHSGTLQRSIDPRAPRFRSRLAFKTRAGGPDTLKLTARPAPRFQALPNSIQSTLGASDPEYLPNVVYISAAQDDQFAQEAALPEAGSAPHGVLTYNFLSAMLSPGADGKSLVADTNHDGVVSMGELSVYLDAQTRAMTDQQQEPSVHFASAFQDRALFTTIAAPVQPPTTPKPAIYAADPRASALLAGSADWRVAASREQADYVWDFAAGDVLRRTGDVVARRVRDLPGLTGVLEKWATVEAIRPFLSEASARVVIGPGRNGVRYEPGARVQLNVVPVAAVLKVSSAVALPPYVTVFNLASDGRVQTLYPVAPEDGEGRMPRGANLPVLSTEVVEPYGTDHVVALLTPERPDNFRNLLRTVEGQRASGRLTSAVKRELAKTGAGLSIGELFTGPNR